MGIYDGLMPKGWETVKLVLLKEMATARTFYACLKTADALFHARLIAEKMVPKVCEEAKDSGGNMEAPEKTNKNSY